MANRRYSSGYYESEGSNRFKHGPGSAWLWGPLLGVLVILVVLAVIWGICWLVAVIFWDAGAVVWRNTGGMIQGALFPGGWPTPFFWILLAVLLSAMGLKLAYDRDSGSAAMAWLLAILMVVGAVALGITKGVTHGILASDYYLTTTTIKVGDPDALPSMLAKYDNNGTLEVDVEQGSLPSGWVPRVASATGAFNVMKKTGDAINNTSLMDDTITYIYGENGGGQWTAIRNGINRQYIYGIATWNGTGDRVGACRFTGDYAIHKTFGGMWPGNNLWNAVAGTYPSFFYNESDMWGYCDGDEPIVVIPGVQLSHYDMQATDASAGVVTIRGSRSGEPVIELFADVQPGDFPGPVYAERLVDNQRNALDWSAGYWQSVNEGFGFDATDVASQAGNNTNYLMQSEADGRLYWVTPLRPQSTDSQTLIAYSVIPADEVSASKLNEQVVYVLNEDDSRVVNLDDLLARVKSTVCEVDTNFCGGNANGRVVEFLPVTDTQWQVFAEVQGRVKYRIDVDVDARIQPKIVDIDLNQTVDPDAPKEPNEDPSKEPNVPPSTATDVNCNDPSSLTDAQLATCLSTLTDELKSRSE